MGGLPVERLRDYLRQLPLGVRARLIAELERAAARGDDIPGGAAVLEEVRGTMQESAPAPRRGTPRELFFKAVEPFLVDAPVERDRSDLVLDRSRPRAGRSNDLLRRGRPCADRRRCGDVRAPRLRFPPLRLSRKPKPSSRTLLATTVRVGG